MSLFGDDDGDDGTTEMHTAVAFLFSLHNVLAHSVTVRQLCLHTLLSNCTI